MIEAPIDVPVPIDGSCALIDALAADESHVDSYNIQRRMLPNHKGSAGVGSLPPSWGHRSGNSQACASRVRNARSARQVPRPWQDQSEPAALNATGRRRLSAPHGRSPALGLNQQRVPCLLALRSPPESTTSAFDRPFPPDAVPDPVLACRATSSRSSQQAPCLARQRRRRR